LKVYKQLAGQTAIYGLSSILGRLLNYFLVPIYTRVFAEGEYGVVTQIFALLAFFNILYTYGLETAYFRFLQSHKGNRNIYASSLISIIVSSILFTAALIIFAEPIAGLLLRDGMGNVAPENVKYLKYFAGILACDAITAIPFARLRQENRAKRFAFLRLFNIGINVGLNLFFLVACPLLVKDPNYSWLYNIYDPNMRIGYVFLVILISNAITLLMLTPEILRMEGTFDKKLWKELLVYAFPLMIAGFAGIINETFDRILIPMLIEDKKDAMIQVGIYGACYKLSIIMTLFIQTFRYAAEPFFFSHSTKENPQHTYAQIMKMFVIVCALIFVGVMLYMDIFKLLIGSKFRSGIRVVPILLMANLCIGVYYNLSIWYKFTAKTRWGAWLSIIGAIITLVFNFALIPVMGYMGAAWATLICYASMMILSYVIGQKHYPVNYDVGSFFYYIILSLVTWMISVTVVKGLALGQIATIAFNSMLLVLFILIIWLKERRKISYLRAS
jgi:O-antigen/teichoic acid export membrane protein